MFAVLTAYHTIGGGALTEPYGDLVIFFCSADIRYRWHSGRC